MSAEVINDRPHHDRIIILVDHLRGPQRAIDAKLAILVLRRPVKSRKNYPVVVRVLVPILDVLIFRRPMKMQNL